MQKTYIAIDLKSFYASVELADRKFDPLTTNLVVADSSRTEKTICLAVSPSLKAHGISGRARLFEVVQRVKEVNAERFRIALRKGVLPKDKNGNYHFTSASFDAEALAADPALELSYIVAPPRMKLYEKISTQIFSIYMLEYMDEKTSDKQFYFGTDDFDHVWEKLIDRAFGERDKEKYFPRSRWLLDYGKYKEKHPLMPDTIMIYNGKYYILDAKCYKYGRTGIPDHLPNGSSINKQITYGEYLEKYKGVDTGSLFNAFIMPYNMADNPFKLTSFVGNIGEAVGDWRYNRKYYERIQGVVMDTRYLMYHYSGKPIKEKVALAECIEAVLGRAAITSTGEDPIAPPPKPVTYTLPEPRFSMVAEAAVPYGAKTE